MYVRDIEESRVFYEGLGLAFVKEKHGNGPVHYSSEHDGMVFELYPNKGEAPLDNTLLGFKIANLTGSLSGMDVDSTYEFDGQTVYVVVDPDGRNIELKEGLSQTA